MSPQVTDHYVEHDENDDFDADLQFVKNPSPRMGKMTDARQMKGGKRFLRDVQDELEEQRTQWEDEVRTYRQD